MEHDWKLILETANDHNSKDTVEQCGKCGLTKHDYQFDGEPGPGKRSLYYPVFYWHGAAIADPGCA